MRIYGKRLTSLFFMWPSSFPCRLLCIISSPKWVVFVCSFFNLRNFQLESDVCHLTYTPNKDSRRFWSRVIHANRREWKKGDSLLLLGKNKPSHKNSLQIQAKSCDFILNPGNLLNAFLVTLLHIYFAMFVLGNDIICPLEMCYDHIWYPYICLVVSRYLYSCM